MYREHSPVLQLVHISSCSLAGHQTISLHPSQVFVYFNKVCSCLIFYSLKSTFSAFLHRSSVFNLHHLWGHALYSLHYVHDSLWGSELHIILLYDLDSTEYFWGKVIFPDLWAMQAGIVLAFVVHRAGSCSTWCLQDPQIHLCQATFQLGVSTENEKLLLKVVPFLITELYKLYQFLPKTQLKNTCMQVIQTIRLYDVMLHVIDLKL